jgi:hypothetical protein
MSYSYFKALFVKYGELNDNDEISVDLDDLYLEGIKSLKLYNHDKVCKYIENKTAKFLEEDRAFLDFAYKKCNKLIGIVMFYPVESLGIEYAILDYKKTIIGYDRDSFILLLCLEEFYYNYARKDEVSNEDNFKFGLSLVKDILQNTLKENHLI